MKKMIILAAITIALVLAIPVYAQDGKAPKTVNLEQWIDKVNDDFDGMRTLLKAQQDQIKELKAENKNQFDHIMNLYKQIGLLKMSLIELDDKQFSHVKAHNPKAP